MKDESIETLLAECRDALSCSKSLTKEIEEMSRCKAFLLEQYRTNKRWYKTYGDGRLTTEDIIITAFEFGWNTSRDFQKDKEIIE